MSDQKPDNPLAFPGDFGDDGFQRGMTLRDYFAGQILPTILPDATSYERAAKDAYNMASEMLKVREAK